MLPARTAKHPTSKVEAYVIKRRDPAGGWTKSPNDARHDKRLSPTARLLLIEVLSLQDGQDITREILADRLGISTGLAKICCRQLIEHGYLHQQRVSEPGTGHQKWIVHYSDTPIERPTPARTEVQNPDFGPDQAEQHVSAGQTEVQNPDIGKSTLISTKTETSCKTSKTEDQTYVPPAPQNRRTPGADHHPSPGDDFPQEQHLEEKLTCWLIAAHLAFTAGIITGQDSTDARTVRWLTATFREDRQHGTRTPLQFCVYLVKILRSASLPVEALAELDGTYADQEDAAEMLALVRQADKAPLNSIDYQACENITSAARQRSARVRTSNDAVAAVPKAHGGGWDSGKLESTDPEPSRSPRQQVKK